MFDRVALKPVLGSLDGYNGTVFAYGQTGSGKTFTITGGAERYVDRGIVPRSISKLFSEISKRTDNASYEVTISYVEVYNDQAYDLLCDMESDSNGDTGKKTTTSQPPNIPNDASQYLLPKVTLLEDDDGVVHTKGCSIHRAGSEEDALNLLFLGDVNRAVAETPMNLASSRSHCVFTMQIEKRETGSEVVKKGKIHLVDLAGSERVSKNGVEDLSTLREAKHINLSLHALEKVVVALSDKDPHVPYRDSVMTMLLKDSLGGNCRTSMVATVTPESTQILEGISTCRFALRIASVTNNLAVNQETDPKLVIKRLRKENKTLREEVKLLRGDDDDRKALTESEINKLRAEVETFCADSVGDNMIDNNLSDKPTASTSSLNLGGSLLKINAAMGVFRDMVRGLRGGARGKEIPQNLSENFKISKNENESERTSDGSTSSSHNTRDELNKLKRVLKQRDDEIAVLVSLLDKGKKNGGASSMGKQSDGDAAKIFSGRDGNTFTETNKNPTSTTHRHTSTYSNLVTLLDRSCFTDKATAFEAFKGVYVGRNAIEENKNVLREKYSVAKKLGEAVNESRTKIQTLKSQVQTLRVKQALANQGDAGVSAVTAVTAVSCDAGMSKQWQEEEQTLFNAIDFEKRSYTQNFNALRDLKKEIENLQVLLERSRGKMMDAYHAWFGDSVDSSGDVTSMSKQSRSSPSSEKENTLAEPAKQISTGNADADADIAAFYAARTKLLRSSSGSR